MDMLDIALRLTAAVLAGMALGLNRDLHDKQTGVRTLGLVALGSAITVLASREMGGPDAVSRVIQGILTGIGFLGAGVIVRPASGSRVHGLTTAACTWLTAGIGIVCALAAWKILVIGVALGFVLLVFGGPFEKWVRRNWSKDETLPD